MTIQSVLNFFNKSGGKLQEREKGILILTCRSHSVTKNDEGPKNLTQGQLKFQAH